MIQLQNCRIEAMYELAGYHEPEKSITSKVSNWYHYLRFIPPDRVIGRFTHEIRLRTVAKINANPITDLEYPHVSDLSRFARYYALIGSRFTEAQQISDGRFVSNGVGYDFGAISKIEWGTEVVDREYNRWHDDLGYFCYLLPLAMSDPQRALLIAAQLCERLDESAPLRLFQRPPSVFSPMSLSKRILSLLSVLALWPGSEPAAPAESGQRMRARQTVLEHLARCERMLKWTLERHLGYNHAVSSNAALAACEAARGRSDNMFVNRVVAELESGVLSDGFWAERSPSYHIHMNFVARSLLEIPALDRSTRATLERIVDQMTDALDVVVHPDGEIAVMNDAAHNDAVTPAVVGWEPQPSSSGRRILDESGYAKMWNDSFCLIMDAGPMGPDEVIGHGHADFLSFELSVRGERMIVDPGLASTAGGPARMWTRSAQSHNGPTFIGLEPAEFFGTWRVGRRGQAWFENTAGVQTLRGVCNGYSATAGLVSRTVQMETGRLSWIDSWEVSPPNQPQCNLFIDGAWSVSQQNDGTVLLQHRQHGWECWLKLPKSTVAVGTARFFPEGSMNSRPATQVLIAPATTPATYEILVGQTSRK
jgi:hypothetical protein